MNYISKTGYVKRIATGEIYEAEIIYLGKFDKADNYEDSSKTEYEAYAEKLAKENEQYELR